MMRQPLALRHREFRRLAVAWFFAHLADSALYLVAAVWVKDLTGSDGAAGMVFFALWLPVLAAPVAGDLADRWSRRRLLLLAYAVLALAVLGLLGVSSADDVWIVYTVVLGYGAVGFLTAAAQSGLVRDLLDDDELASGNGVLSTIDQGMRLVSPLVGTAVYWSAGPHAVIGLTAGCFAVAGLLLARVQVAESEPTPAAERAGYLTEVLGGIRHLTVTPVLNLLTVALAVGLASNGLTNVVVFAAMEDGLGVPATMLGPLSSVEGAGAVLGGMTVAWAVRRWGEAGAVTLGLACFGTGMIPLAGSSVALVAAGFAVQGFGIPWMVAGYVTARQRLTPAALQGRASAASNLLANLPQALFTALAAGAIGVLDYRLLVGVTVCGIAAAAAVAGRAARRAEPPAYGREGLIVDG